MKTVATVLGFVLLAVHPVSAATPPAGFADSTLFTASQPTGMAYEPGTGNLFAIEKGNSSGNARVLRRAAAGGAVTEALTLTCVDNLGERGLLGIAFDPDYLQSDSTRYVYLYYTRKVSGACALPGQTAPRNRVVRFLEHGGFLSTEQLLLEGPGLGATNHNGGTLRFAPDKTLFVSMGDNDTDANANPLSRDLSDIRGKLLRIARDGTAPADNPFVGQAGVRPEIWAWGLRNPFRFSIDPANGNPWIADVGENTWEEIDLGVAGADYGYPCYEANAPFQPCSPPPANPTFPNFYYGHTVGPQPFSGATIIGGPLYRGGNFPASYQGRLFFADYISGWMRSAAISGGTFSDVQLFMPDVGSITDIVQAPNGCLGWVNIGNGGIHETCYIDDRDGDGFTVSGGDCNDLDATVYPGAPQLCDGRNNNCSDPAWPAVPANEANADGDAFRVCEGDCDDTRASVYPGAPQLCDGINDNCSDPSWPAVPPNEVNADGDGFRICQGDCDDTRASVYPGAPELCDGLDNNCNGQADEDAQGLDSDADGIRNACDNCPLVANLDQADTDADGRGDLCDNCMLIFNPAQDDLDNDRVGNPCDNCPLDFNPSQTDFDQDGEGDICDVNDGLIYLFFTSDVYREWQQESGYQSWNSYRGSLAFLRGTGEYTQSPGSNALAARDCGLTDPYVFDDVLPTTGSVAFQLVTGVAGGVEGGLGTNGAGVPRTNSNPCP
jgi:glucose/arabinose dehydrogenase